MAKENAKISLNGTDYTFGNNKSSQKSTEAVLKDSAPVPEGVPHIGGIEFDDFKDRDVSVTDLLLSMTNMGFQASKQTPRRISYCSTAFEIEILS